MKLLEIKIKEYFTELYSRILGTVIVMELSLVQKSMLVLGMVLILSLFFLLYIAVVLLHPEWHAFINIQMFYLLGWQIATIILLSTILMWCCIFLQKNSPDNQYMSLIVTVFFATSICVMSYMLGAMSPATGIFMVGSPIIGLALFARAIILPLTILSMFSMVVLAYAGTVGWIPYAPLFTELTSVHLTTYSTFCFYSQLYFLVPPSLIIIILSDVILKQWHERGREVALLSQLDSLTNLYNRRTVNEHLERLLEMSTESDRISILLLDLDFFKQVNDTYGHMVGDDVLREVGHLLQSIMRKNDLAGRFGGEEFIVVLYRSAHDIGMSVAERIRARIAEIRVATPAGKPVQITVSVGVSTFSPFGMTGIDQILSQADQALYTAKDAGRNQVVHYDQLSVLNPAFDSEESSSADHADVERRAPNLVRP